MFHHRASLALSLESVNKTTARADGADIEQSDSSAFSDLFSQHIYDLSLSVWCLCLAVEAVVEFDYEAQQDDELSLTVGDVIVNIRRDDGGWWEGELRGRRGLFPDNFVRVSRTQTRRAAKSLPHRNLSVAASQPPPPVQE